MAAAKVSHFCMFRNSATAHNYVGFIRWACVHLGVSIAWHAEVLHTTLKGARHRNLRLTGGAKHAARLLTQEQVQQIVVRADQMGMKDYACFVLVCWEYLLRVQSEGFPLLAGVPDDATSLPSGRHSGVWVDGDDTLCLRLQQRKNRVQGSLLRRRCGCVWSIV